MNKDKPTTDDQRRVLIDKYLLKLDHITPKYWTPELVKTKPGTYVKELNRWLNDAIDEALTQENTKTPTHTTSGYKVIDFKKIESPIDRYPMSPFIYSGNVLIPDLGKTNILWDKDGKCGNTSRDDCYINLTQQRSEDTQSAGYFKLKTGDIIKAGDEYLGIDNKWHSSDLFIGQTYFDKDYVDHRRRLNTEPNTTQQVKEAEQWKALYQKRGRIMEYWIDKYSLPVGIATLDNLTQDRSPLTDVTTQQERLKEGVDGKYFLDNYWQGVDPNSDSPILMTGEQLIKVLNNYKDALFNPEQEEVKEDKRGFDFPYSVNTGQPDKIPTVASYLKDLPKEQSLISKMETTENPTVRNSRTVQQVEEKRCPKCKSKEVGMFTSDMDWCTDCKHQWYV